MKKILLDFAGLEDNKVSQISSFMTRNECLTDYQESYTLRFYNFVLPRLRVKLLFGTIYFKHLKATFANWLIGFCVLSDFIDSCDILKVVFFKGP